MNITCLPLDERPCNYDYLKKLYATHQGLSLKLPEHYLLGNKRIPANTKTLESFILDNPSDCYVLSIDMLLYGGLIPSRLHHLSDEHLEHMVTFLRQLKKTQKHAKIFAFSCIMRCPTYDSSEEEPDYYAEYGNMIYQYGYNQDFNQREGKSLEVMAPPKEILYDYELRRDFNLKVNLAVVSLLSEGILDYLVIPQDDSSPYGYTSKDQKHVLSQIKELQLESRVSVYPGADEVALSLITRAWHEQNNAKPLFYPIYASTLGPSIIPKYEDRPMFETLKAHLQVVGGGMAFDYQSADYILFINSPGKVMEEAFDQSTRDATYDTFRHLSSFVDQMALAIKNHKKVLVVDAGYSNGGDLDLIRMMEQKNVLGSIHGYAGWNTHANTLGTVLAMGCASSHLTMQEYTDFLVLRLIEDVWYQSVIRQQTIREFLVEHQLSYYDFKDKEIRVCEYIKNQLNKLIDQSKFLSSTHRHVSVVTTPWHRMFEIGIELT